MATVSCRAAEIARETESQLLQALASPGAVTDLAQQTGSSVSAVSKWKTNGGLTEASRYIANLGFRIVRADCRVAPPDAVVIDREAYQFAIGVIGRLMETEEGRAQVMGVKA